MRWMWGRWAKGGKGGEVCGTQENPPRDTGEVSRGAFSLVCEIMWRLPYLEQVGRVVAIGKERAISFDSLLRFASHAHPSSSPPPTPFYYIIHFHTIPYHTFMHLNQILLLSWQNLTRPGSIHIQYHIHIVVFLFSIPI